MEQFPIILIPSAIALVLGDAIASITTHKHSPNSPNLGPAASACTAPGHSPITPGGRGSFYGTLPLLDWLQSKGYQCLPLTLSQVMWYPLNVRLSGCHLLPNFINYRDAINRVSTQY